MCLLKCEELTYPKWLQGKIFRILRQNRRKQRQQTTFLNLLDMKTNMPAVTMIIKLQLLIAKLQQVEKLAPKVRYFISSSQFKNKLFQWLAWNWSPTDNLKIKKLCLVGMSKAWMYVRKMCQWYWSVEAYQPFPKFVVSYRLVLFICLSKKFCTRGWKRLIEKAAF